MTPVTEPNDAPALSEKTPVTLALVGLIVGWVVAALMAYNAFDSRVSVIESQMQRQNEDIAEMKGDIKTLVRRPQ